MPRNDSLGRAQTAPAGGKEPEPFVLVRKTLHFALFL